MVLDATYKLPLDSHGSPSINGPRFQLILGQLELPLIRPLDQSSSVPILVLVQKSIGLTLILVHKGIEPHNMVITAHLVTIPTSNIIFLYNQYTTL